MSSDYERTLMIQDELLVFNVFSVLSYCSFSDRRLCERGYLAVRSTAELQISKVSHHICASYRRDTSLLFYEVRGITEPGYNYSCKR